MQQRLQLERLGIEPLMSMWVDSKMNFHVEHVSMNRPWLAQPNGQWPDRPQNMKSMFHFKWNTIHVPFTRSMFHFNGSMFRSSDPCSVSMDPCSMHSTISSKKQKEIKLHAFYTSSSFPSEK